MGVERVNIMQMEFSGKRGLLLVCIPVALLAAGAAALELSRVKYFVHLGSAFQLESICGFISSSESFDARD